MKAVTPRYTKSIKSVVKTAVTRLLICIGIFLFVFLNGKMHAQTAALNWVNTTTRTSGSTGDALSNSRAVVRDASGNIYITGLYKNLIDFDQGPGIATLTTSTGYGIFLAKYSANGVYQWAQTIAYTQTYAAQYNLAVDGSGNIYVTGDFYGSIFFSPNTQTAVTSAGGSDAFLIKYNSGGTFQWSKKMGGALDDNAYGITTDASGNVFVAGSFEGTANFNVGGSNGSMTAVAAEDGFLVKYNTNGTYQWKTSRANSMINSATVDASGNIYVAGNNAYSAVGGRIFIIKYNTSGTAQWTTETPETTTASYAGSLALDVSGNIYVTGFFQYTMNFNPAGSAILSTSGQLDAFVAKYNSTGGYLWANKIGGSATDIAYDVAVDASGNSYVTGYFTGTANFNSGGSFNLTSYGTTDIFLTKFNSTGVFQSASQAGGASDDVGYAVSVDNSGNAWVTGTFLGAASFNQTGTVTITSNNPYNDHTGAFVANYNANGICQWAFATQAHFVGDEECRGVASDANGNVYSIGLFKGTVDLDAGVGVTSVSSSTKDMFITKHNAAGVFQWGFAIGGTSDDAINAVTVDGNGNLYVTGSFSGTVNFNPSGTANLTAANLNDGFVAKYNSNGVYQWAFKFGGTYGDAGSDLAIDNSGNLYVTGSFSTTTNFDPNGMANLTVYGSNDIFLAKYTSSGLYQWAIKLGGIYSDNANGLAVDNAGNVCLTGAFYGTANFNPSGSANLTATGNYSDIFVAKYDPNGGYLWAFNTGGTILNDIGYDIGTDSNGNVYVTGSFYGTANFNPNGSANLTSAGIDDIFFAKYSSGSIYQWAVSLGGTQPDFGYGTAVDGFGNVYIAGQFNGTANFNPSGPTNLTSAGGNDGFIAKYNSNGVYQWASKIGGSGADAVQDITHQNGNIYVAGSYTGPADFSGVTLSNSGKNGFVAKYSETVTVPSVSIMASPGNIICPNASVTFTATPVDGGTSPFYQWKKNGVNVGINSATYTETAVLSNDQIYVVMTSNHPNAAGVIAVSNTITMSIAASTLAQPGTITVSGGSTTVCPGDVRTYTINPVANATSYNWTPPTGSTISSGQGTTSVTVTYNAGFTATGTLSVVAMNACTTSVPRNLTIYRNSPATPSVITGQSTAVCAGTTKPYSITAVAGMTYVWSTTSTNATITAGQGTSAVTVTFNSSFTSTTLSAQAQNACGLSTKRNLVIQSVPTQPSSISGQSSVVCAGTTKPYSVTAVAGLTYVWSFSNTNATITSGQGTSAVTVTYGNAFVNGTLSVKAQNACGLSTPRNLTITSVPSTPGTVTGQATGVCNSTVNYSVTAVVGLTYVWSTTVTAATITPGPAPGNTATVTWPSFTTGTLTVKAQNACGLSSPRNVTVTGVPPQPGTITASGPACPGATITYSIAPVNGATSYTWTAPSGSTINSGQGTTSVSITFGATSGSVTVKGVNACGNSSLRTLAVAFTGCRSEDDAIDALLLYPNPTSGTVNVVLPRFNGDAMLHLISSVGQQMQSLDLNSDVYPSGTSLTFDISAYATGVYQIVLQTSDGRQVLRFVKQ